MEVRISDCTRNCPQNLCKIWVGSLVGLRTISALSRKQISKIKTFSLSQKSLVFIKMKCSWNNQLVFIIVWIMCFYCLWKIRYNQLAFIIVWIILFLVSLENQVVVSWPLQQLWEGIYFFLLCEKAAWLFVSYSWFGA